MHLSKQWRIWAVLALVPALALMGCEGTTGEDNGDATQSGDVTGGGTDAVTTDSGGTPAKAYRYILVQEDPENLSIKECEAGDETPGADIDAVALYRGTDVISWCETITWRTGDDRGTAFCKDGDDNPKDPTEANAAAAVGRADACLADFSAPECPALQAEKWIWLNGGEIMCELAADAAITEGDNIVVYEVFSQSKEDKKPGSSIESYKILVSDSDAGPWTPLGKGTGIAPVTVPAL